MERPKVIFLDVIETLVNIEGIKGIVSKLLGNNPHLEIGRASCRERGLRLV